jgi:hypothetical protein
LIQINELDAPLYIDVYCYGCKRRVAMSNTIENDGRRFCYRCFTAGGNDCLRILGDHGNRNPGQTSPDTNP